MALYCGRIEEYEPISTVQLEYYALLLEAEKGPQGSYLPLQQRAVDASERKECRDTDRHPEKIPSPSNRVSVATSKDKDSKKSAIKEKTAEAAPQENASQDNWGSMMSMLSGGFVNSMFDDGTTSEQYEGAASPSQAECEEDMLTSHLAGIISESVDLTYISSSSYWEKIAPDLNISDDLQSRLTAAPTSREQSHDELSKSLKEEGFFVHESLAKGAKYEALAGAVRRLKSFGWPPVFALVYDEFWELILQIWDTVEPLLDCSDTLLEPSVFLWALAPRRTSQQPGKRTDGDSIGNNFGLPHRDYPYDECHFSDGRYKILNIWMPLTEATLDNGCLYVLPKEFDEFFSHPESTEHMRCATPAFDGATKIRFDIQGARPLPGPAGQLICWEGNLIHWGSRCSSRAKVPRISIACTFRHPAAGNTHITSDGVLPSLSRAQLSGSLSLKDRLRLIAKSLLIYKFWYPMEKAMFPAEFFDAAKRK